MPTFAQRIPLPTSHRYLRSSFHGSRSTVEIMRKPSLRVEREFGYIVGGVLVLLSAWWFYRGKFHRLSEVTSIVGSMLLILAFIFPRALVWPNKAWMALAEVLSFVT